MSDFFGMSPGNIPPEVKEIIKNSNEEQVVEMMMQSLKYALDNPDELKKAMPGVPAQALASMKFFPRTDAALRPMAKVMADLLIQQVKYGKEPTPEEVTKAVSGALMGSGAFGGLSPDAMANAMKGGIPGFPNLGGAGGRSAELADGITVPATSPSASTSSIDSAALSEYQKQMASGKNRMAELEFSEAEANFSRAVELIDPHQEEGEELFSALQHLSIAQLEQDKYEDAEEILKRWLKMGERIYSPEHQLLAGAYLGLARVRESQKKFNDAELLYNRALSIAETAGDDDLESHVSTLESVAYFYDSRKRYKKADSLFEKSYSLKKDAYGDDSLEVAEYEVQYAAVLNEREQYEEALQWLDKAYAKQVEITDAIDPDVLATRLVKIESLIGLARLDDAEAELSELMTIFEENGDEDSLTEAKELLSEIAEMRAGSGSNNGSSADQVSVSES